MSTDLRVSEEQLGPDFAEEQTDSRLVETASRLPLWFEAGLLAAATGVLSFGGFGVLFAFYGRYRMLPVFALSVAATVLLCWCAWPRLRGRARPAGRSAPTLALCLISGGLTIWNAAHDGHHVALDIDSGGYSVAGRWIASHGSLVVPAGASWPHDGSGLTLGSAAMYVRPGGILQFQFVHFLPALMGEAYNVAGDRAMFAVVALLGGLALCAIYAVGCRFTDRAWLVVAAVTALGLSLPEVWVSRDPFSETSTQFLLWSGIWLMGLAFEQRRAGPAFVAGMLVAGTLMTRIDAFIYLLPLPLLAAGAWLGAVGPCRRSLARTGVAFVLGAVGPCVLGTADLLYRSTGYYHDLSHDVISLRKAMVVSVAVGLLLVLVGPRLGAVEAAFKHSRDRIAASAGTIVGALLLVAWALRPTLETQRFTGIVNPTVAGAQRAEGLTVDPARSYGEQTMRWMDWYLGPVTTTLGILGAALLVLWLVKRPSPAMAAALAIAGTCSALYLWDPQITPTQIYVMRRFVPATLPLLVLAAAYAADRGTTALQAIRAPRAGARMWLWTAAFALPIFAAGMLWPVRDFRVQAGYNGVVDETCRAMGPDGAALLLPDGQTDSLLPQAVRSWCDVPVASFPAGTPVAAVREIAAEMKLQGRVVWLLGSSAQALSTYLPGSRPELFGSAVNDRQLQWTLSRPPGGYISQHLSVYGEVIKL